MEDWFKPNGLPSINKEFTYLLSLLTLLTYLLEICKFQTRNFVNRVSVEYKAQ